MANEEQVNILKQGVEVWNTWRDDNPGVRPDLSDADLSGASLKGVNLSVATLFRVNFTGADLTGADLTRANLASAVMENTVLIDALLRGAFNLDYVIHTGPSQIDCNTIKLAQGHLPESFLKGVCKPEQLEEVLAYRNTLLAQPDPERTIIREIEFEPQYKQACISILNYFDEVLKLKYPDLDVTVTIRQDGLKVKMEIEAPEGKKDLIAETLRDFGLVVTGQKPPEALLADTRDVLKLQVKLESSRSEFRSTTRLLDFAEHEEIQLAKMNDQLMKMVGGGDDQ